MIATSLKHFDTTHQMLVTYSWGALVTDEHYDFLLKRDRVCYDASRGKEVDEFTHDLDVTVDSLHCT